MIKYYFSFLVLVFSCVTVQSFAQSDLFSEDFNPLMDLDEAVEIAKTEKKPLFIFIGREACGNCHGTLESIQEDFALKTKLQNDVVFVWVDTDGEQGGAAYWMLMDEGGSFSLPLMGIVDTQTEEVYVSSMGYKSANFVSSMLDEVN